MKRIKFVLTLLCMCVAGIANAEMITIQSADMENKTGWVVQGTYANIDPLRGGLSQPGHGTYDFFTNGDGTTAGYFYQVLSTTLKANTEYTLTIQAGKRSDLVWGGGTLGLGTGSTYDANLLTPTEVVNPTPASATWVTWSCTFVTDSHTAGIGDAIRIQVKGNKTQACWDNVTLEAVSVPEPTTIALIVMGSLGVISVKKRK